MCHGFQSFHALMKENVSEFGDRFLTLAEKFAGNDFTRSTRGELNDFRGEPIQISRDHFALFLRETLESYTSYGSRIH